MEIGKVKQMDAQGRFLYWIWEREEIRLKRLEGEPKPWTDDVILQSYRFCNVRRMDDKVSQWLYSNWYGPNFDHKNMLLACLLARFFNEPAPLKIIGFPYKWVPDLFKSKLRKLRETSDRIFNNAYMVRGNDGIDKIECVIDYYVGPFATTPIVIDRDSMEETWNRILPYYGMGSFMAGQAVADLRWGLSGEWGDARSWAPKGPGSQRGLNRLLGRELKAPISQYRFNQKLQRYVIDVGLRKLPASITDRLEAIDWQNCLCEFDKYERALSGEGRPKQLYSGK